MSLVIYLSAACPADRIQLVGNFGSTERSERFENTIAMFGAIPELMDTVARDVSHGAIDVNYHLLVACKCGALIHSVRERAEYLVQFFDEF